MYKKYYLFILLLAILFNKSFSQSLTGPTSVCPGQTVTYVFNNQTVPSTNCNNVQMDAFFNGVLIKQQTFASSGSSNNKTNFSVTWPSGLGTGIIYATGFQCCIFGCGDINRSLNVTVGPRPNISASTTVPCPGSTITINASSSCIGSYYFEAPAGWIFPSSGTNFYNGAPASVSLIVPSTAGGTTALVKAAVNLPQGRTPYNSLNITPTGSPSGSYVYKSSGPSGYCPNSSYVFSVSAPYGSSLSNWQVTGTISSYIVGSNYVSVSTNSNSNTSIGIGVTVTSCGTSILTGNNFGGGCGNFALTASQVNAYPNPTTNSTLTIEWPDSATVDYIELVNPQEKTVKKISPVTNKVVFDVKGLPESDLYFVRLKNDKQEIRKRIVISGK